MSWFLFMLLGNFAHVPCGRTNMGQTDARLWAQSVSQGCFFSPPQGLAYSRTERPLIVLTTSTGRYRSPEYVHHYTLSPSDLPTSTVVFWVLPWIKADQREPQERGCGRCAEAQEQHVFIKTDPLCCVASFTLMSSQEGFCSEVCRLNIGIIFFFEGKKAVSSTCSVTNITAFAPWSQQIWADFLFSGNQWWEEREPLVQCPRWPSPKLLFLSPPAFLSI